MEEKSKSLPISEIIKLLPHRYPFLLVDKVVDYTDTSLKALKNVSLLYILKFYI